MDTEIEEEYEGSEYVYDEEYERDSRYGYELDQFEGVEGYFLGIFDELENLRKLINLIGESVVKEEIEFMKIEAEDYDPDIVFLSERVMDAWHKKSYRPFSYKAMFMLAQSIFETGVLQLRQIMIEAKTLAPPKLKKERTVLDSLKDFCTLTTELHNVKDSLRLYGFIRNKITHTDGYFKKKFETVTFQELSKFAQCRNDIVVTERKKGDASYRFEVTLSTVITDYIDTIESTFKILIAAARKAPYIS